jgi:hypothetical protein
VRDLDCQNMVKKMLALSPEQLGVEGTHDPHYF